MKFEFDSVLSGLRVGLHVMFAFLLGFGVLRAGVDGRLDYRAVLLAGVLAVVYVAGTWQEKRGVPQRRATRYSWLALVTLLWLGLVVHTPDFLWLEFPLAFLYLHLLPTVPGLVAVAGAWAVAAFVPAWLHPADWTVAAAIGPAIGTLFAVAIYYSYRALAREADHHRKVAEQLRATHEELAAAEHQAGRLEERERLSREIHDTVAQGLNSIVLLARATRAQAPDSTQEALSTIESVARENLAEARRFVRDLTAADSARPLPEAAAEVLARMRRRGKALGEPTAFELHTHGQAAALPEPVYSAALRCVQEGLNNVVKHAHASRAVVTLGLFKDAVTVDVVDDGDGADGHFGYGLRGLARRVEDLGGSLSLESTGAAGTALAVSIPLTSQHAPQAQRPGQVSEPGPGPAETGTQ